MKEDIIYSTTSKLNTVNISIHTIPEFAKECIICGENVELTDDEVTMLEWGKPIPSKVCDKCRDAVMQVRVLMSGINHKE